MGGYQHAGKSQVGQKLRARVVDYDQLPAWVQNAVKPSIMAKLSPQDRMLIHKMQAEQLRATAEICEAYLEALD